MSSSAIIGPVFAEVISVVQDFNQPSLGFLNLRKSALFESAVGSFGIGIPFLYCVSTPVKWIPPSNAYARRFVHPPVGYVTDGAFNSNDLRIPVGQSITHRRFWPLTTLTSSCSFVVIVSASCGPWRRRKAPALPRVSIGKIRIVVPIRFAHHHTTCCRSSVRAGWRSRGGTGMPPSVRVVG